MFRVFHLGSLLTLVTQLFEHQSRNIIGLERLMLEASSFDFRNRHPQPLIVKIARRHGFERHSAVTKTAYQISLDLYRTFAPLKQSTPTMAFACLELSCRLHGQEKAIIMDGKDYIRWGIDRSMVMGTYSFPFPAQTQADFLYINIKPPRTSNINIRDDSRNNHNTIIIKNLQEKT